MQIEGTKLIKVFDSDISEGGRFEILQSVTEIGASSFKDNKKLTTVSFNENLTQIGDDAFYRCTGLTTVTLNENLTQIGNSAFNGCTGLTTVTFNEKLTQIGSTAFYSCTGLTMVTLNEKLTQIGNCAFNGCTRLTTVTLNKKLTQIGIGAFYGCTGLTTVTLNEKLTQIGNGAFEGCTGLKKIVIDTEDDANFNRIRNLLPEELRARCIKKSLNERLDRIKEDSLKSILAEPATNSMRRLMKVETYTRDVWLLLNKYTQESNVFYKKAQFLMDALDVPKSNDEEALTKFKEAYKKICDDCLQRTRAIYEISAKARFFPNKETKEHPAEEVSWIKKYFNRYIW